MSSKRTKNVKEARELAAIKWSDERHKPPIIAKTPNQDTYIKALKNPDLPVIIASGAAGSGKTYLACSYAADMFMQSRIHKIILCRANIPTGRSLGFFKGDKDDKMLNWLMPMIDVLKQRMGAGRFETSLNNGLIELQPLETIRGRSFGGEDEGAFFLIDEAQQMTVEEIKAVCTRVGENCKLILMGDLAQSDIKETSGLGKLIHLAKKYMLPVTIVDFELDDIQRSSVCRMFVETFYKEGL
jgi:phosphate starvation-inducible PhoH-like protein|tara:strand:+ start:381 stop:1106 length:726 start_codon:yes stop_codon:yes gene_type:complete